MVIRVTIYLLLPFVLLPGIVDAQTFTHPGLLQSREDLERMKTAVAAKQEPIYSGYQVFIQHPASQSNYTMQGPLAMVGRNPTVGQITYDNDANAAYQHALMWAITGEHAYADTAIKILNAWSATLRSITGRDAVLMAGLGPFKMVNAAEIIRYTNAGWTNAEIQQTEKHFKEVLYPVLKDFAPFANGNWDAAAIKTVMAIGIFCNDRAMYERALQYYVNGGGNGRLTNYVINQDGQIQETGRDQAHTQLGIALLGDCCEMAWHQGLDLYGYANNRLLKGFEYTAKYNLGNEVPFMHELDRTGKYEHFKPSEQARGELRAVYEQIYNHYVNRMGLAAPFTKQAAEKIRPEGPGKPGADHPGYGTLLYTRPAGSAIINKAPAAPGGIIATGSSQQITLTWVAAIGAATYSVKRAVKSGGPYTTIAKGVTSTNYTDKQVKPGVVYFYTLTATNAKGESPHAFEVSCAAGLPIPWKQQAIGTAATTDKANYNGNEFRIEAWGNGLNVDRDTCFFVFRSLNGDGSVTVRINPQPSSQFSNMGLMMREALSADAAHASLLLYPGKSNSVEAPSWHLRLLSRTKAGALTRVDTIGQPLAEPAVTYGRLTGYYWLRLQRKGNDFTGFGSYDGKEWTPIGTVRLPLKKELLVGMPVASGMPNSTIVQLDRVSITNEPEGTSQALDYCVTQLSKTMGTLHDSTRIPRSIANGKTDWRFVGYRDWTSGFWPGILWYAYEYTHDEQWKQQAARYSAALFPLADTAAIDHDLGFQVFPSIGNGYRLTQDPKYKAILLRTADTLSKLFNPKVGTILSWPRAVPGVDWPLRHNTIMDNMINLELLFWASKNGGHKRLYDIAVKHAETTMHNHFRPDYTSYHVVVYDTATGERVKGITHQGFSDSSMWARGQAWAIYGFTMVARETSEIRFLDFAQKITDVYLDKLPADLIPYWDFNAPDIPNAPRDASAAAVVASGLLQLSTMIADTAKANYYRTKAEAMLASLSTDKYQSRNVNNAFLLHSTGHKPNGGEIDASIIYADYYYLEALLRLKKIKEGGLKK